MPLKLAIFDCDGTLVDSRQAILATMAKAFTDAGQPPPPDWAVRHVIGLSLDQAIEALAPSLDDHSRRHVAARYRQIASRANGNAGETEKVFDGVPEVLDTLDAAGILLAVATGKGRRALETSLQNPALRGRFVSTVTADDAPSKPAPDMALTALADTGVRAEDAVVIGDTDYDITMARGAGVAGIGVAWGHHPTDRLLQAGAACVIDRPDRLAASILHLLNGGP